MPPRANRPSVSASRSHPQPPWHRRTAPMPRQPLVSAPTMLVPQNRNRQYVSANPLPWHSRRRTDGHNPPCPAKPRPDRQPRSKACNARTNPLAAREALPSRPGRPPVRRLPGQAPARPRAAYPASTRPVLPRHRPLSANDVRDYRL